MFTIRRATPRDEGMYYCMASKEGISVESNKARVRVDGKDKLLNTTMLRHASNFMQTNCPSVLHQLIQRLAREELLLSLL